MVIRAPGLCVMQSVARLLQETDSQREGTRGEKGQRRVKVSEQPPPAPTASPISPCPTIIQNIGRPDTGSLPRTIAPPVHPTTGSTGSFLIVFIFIIIIIFVVVVVLLISVFQERILHVFGQCSLHAIWSKEKKRQNWSIMLNIDST